MASDDPPSGSTGALAADAGSNDDNARSYAEISDRLRRSIELTYSNKFQEASGVLDEASSLAKQRSDAYPDEPNVEAFILVFNAFASFVAGVTALQNNQRDALLEKLLKAEATVDKGPEWAGKPLVRAAGLFSCGLCTFVCGVTSRSVRQCGQGVWKIVRALGQLRGGSAIKAACEYEGRERDVLRAMALCTNANANLIVADLPPFVLSTASRFMNFSGDRDAAFADFETLWREDIVLSPLAAATMLGNFLDDINMGNLPKLEQAAMIPDLLVWSEERFPNSVLFTNWRALQHARQRNVETAYGLQKENLAGIDEEYPGMQVLNHAIMGQYAMAMLRWEDAARHFRDAHAVLKRVGRRAGGPENAGCAAACFAMAGDTAAAEEMFSEVQAYTKEKKSDWPPGDKDIFWAMKEVKEDERPLRIAMNKLVFWWWCVRNMQPATGEKLVEILKGYGESSGDGTSRVFASSLLADAYRQLDDADSALRTCDEALAGVDGKSHSNGAVPLLLYTKARIQADRGNVTVATDALRRLRALPKDYPQHDALSARVLKLEKQVGVRASSACTEVKVPARKIESVELRVPADVPGEVRWDFMLEDRDIGFSASFRPQDVAEWTELQREARWEATDGPLSGTMRPEGPGTLRLEFDNTFSWVRGKVISYQVDPPLELAVP